jgi:RNA polymerase sigma factor (sigma-70 family)
MALTLSKSSKHVASSEHDLVAAVRAGHDRAFEELYARYRERISAFILSRVHDHGRAEDIAQEVFMSALRRMRGSEQEIAFKPWIYEIAKNACIDEFRRGSRAREVPLESDGEFVVDRQKSALAAVPTPAAAVESKQRLDDLRGAFGGLSASHHQLLVMREFEGLSYDEIGARLGMTRQMVESSLFRARRKLTEEYEELASGQRCEQIQSAIDAGRLRAVGSLGIRDRRRFARHLSHCQPCRHVALMSGVDETLLKPRRIAAKIAALLPIPIWRFPWRSRGARAASAGGSHHAAGAGSAGLIQSAGSAITFGQAAATVAVIVAGAGGGLAAVHGISSGGHHHAAASSARSASQSASASGGSGTATSPAAAKASSTHASLTNGATALRFAGSQSGSARPGGVRKRQSGSAPGAPGSGSSSGGSGSSTAGRQGTAASRPGSSAAAKVSQGLTKTVTGVTNGVNKTVTGVANGLNSTVTNTTNGVDKTVHQVTSTLNNVTNGVGSAVNKVTNGGVNLSQPIGTVNKVVGSVGNGVADAGTKAVNGAVGSVTGTVQKVTSTATGGQAGSSAPSPSPGSPAAPSSAPASSTSSGAGGSVTQPLKSALGGLLGGK